MNEILVFNVESNAVEYVIFICDKRRDSTYKHIKNDKTAGTSVMKLNKSIGYCR